MHEEKNLNSGTTKIKSSLLEYMNSVDMRIIKKMEQDNKEEGNQNEGK